MFKHTGDGVCGAFASPRSAVDAAVAAQRALDLPVRMGIATGEAQLRDGDYFGAVLNRAARVMAVGHGGQILLDGTTAGLISGVDLISSGSRRLREIAKPVDVFQVQAVCLRTEVPPLNTVDRTSGNLRAPTTSFVGREAELAELDGAECAPVGNPHGCRRGRQTRLALELAVRSTENFPDGVFVIEMAAVGDPAAVPEAVAAVLDAAADMIDSIPSSMWVPRSATADGPADDCIGISGLECLQCDGTGMVRLDPDAAIVRRDRAGNSAWAWMFGRTIRLWDATTGPGPGLETPGTSCSGLQKRSGESRRRATYSTTMSLSDTDTVPRPRGQTFVSILNVVPSPGIFAKICWGVRGPSVRSRRRKRIGADGQTSRPSSIDPPARSARRCRHLRVTEVFAVDVSDGIRSRTGHRPRGQVGHRAHCDLLCHASLPVSRRRSLPHHCPPAPGVMRENTPRTPLVTRSFLLHFVSPKFEQPRNCDCTVATL